MKMKKIKESKSLINLLNSWKELVKNKHILFVNKKNETDIIKLSRLKEHDYLLTKQLLKGQVDNYQKDTNNFMKKLHELYEKQI